MIKKKGVSKTEKEERRKEKVENIGKWEVNKAKERVTHKHRVEKAHKR